MRKGYLAIAIFSALILLFTFSTASASTKRGFRLPSWAKEIAPDTYYLGAAEEEGLMLQGYAFVRYHKGYARFSYAKMPGNRTTCYGFLANGARWKTTEGYVLGEANADGLLPEFISSVTETSLETWDRQVTFEIFGLRNTSAVVDGADTTAPDGKNEIYFGSIEKPGVIAVTVVWGVFSGPLPTRKLVEYDVIFDDVDFAWGDAATNPTLMDYQNIATHEFGHAAGMNDLYVNSCAEETMYGYAIKGETKKRDLNIGDITGIKTLY